MHMVKFVFFVLVTLSFCHNVLSQNSRFKTSVIPITKDAETSLHKVTWGYQLQTYDGEPYLLIDLDAPFIWKDCELHKPDVACGLEEGCRFPLPCNDPLCIEAKSYFNPICPSLDNLTAKYHCRICAVTPLNPISNICKISQLTTDLISLYTTNGRTPSTGANNPFGNPFVLSCAPHNLLPSFPKGVRGVAAFSWSNLAFPRQVTFPKVADKFALCLPSTSSALGVAFLGDGPFYFTSLPKLDLRSILSYTPMIRMPSKSLGFYIGINRILIQGTPLPVPILKSGSVKLSTRILYTTLKTDIYKALVTSFSKATKNIPQVNAVKPFSLCFKTSSIGSVGIPKIDIETESGKIWSISIDNSMKDTGNGVSCLAFVDGGLGTKEAIVIGTYQMENNFLFFDLENQKLGFSSSLLPRGTSCSNFNLTVTQE